MSENTVIQMYTATQSDAAASIDVPDEGLILFAHGVIRGTANLDGEGAQAELSFGSVNAFSTNDARQTIAHWEFAMGMLTSGAGPGSASQSFDYGEGLKVFGGERLYIHSGAVSTGAFLALHISIVFRFKSFLARRR